MGDKSLGILDLIRSRRTVRIFEPKPISKELLTAILEAGRWAPSGMNNQPWRFVIIEDEERRFKLAEMTKYSSIILLAPVSIAVFLDEEASYSKEKDILAIGACIQNMLLQVHALGIGACWLGEILNRAHEVARLLDVPDSYRLLAVLAVGYPKMKSLADTGERKPLSELIYGSWIVD